MFVHGASLYRDALPDDGKRLLQSRRAVDDEELRSPQTTLDQVVEDRAPSFRAFSAHALDRQQHFWPSARTPMTTSSEIVVAFRSSRTRTTNR